MRPLIIDDLTRLKIDRVRAFAEARENWYAPYESDRSRVPGDHPQYVCQLQTYRCVFSITRSANGEELFRHLSISIPGQKYANPYAVYFGIQIGSLVSYRYRLIEEEREGTGGRLFRATDEKAVSDTTAEVADQPRSVSETVWRMEAMRL